MHTATVVPSPKTILRTEALAGRKAYARSLTPERRGRSEQRLLHRVLARLDDAVIIASYHPIRDEIDPLPIQAALIDSERIVALPWFAGRDAPMIFRKAPAVDVGPWGMLQPASDAAVVRPEVVLVPLVATDARGNRIGHGMGHYDRALSNLRSTGRLRAIGLCWDCQVLDAFIPVDPWDVPLDAVATPDHWIERTSA